MTLLIVLPAAGASSRMRGRDKLLETIGGEPLLRRQARHALTTGCRVVVTLPVGDAPRREALRGLSVGIEEIPDAASGMSASLRRASALLGPGEALGVLLPDVPGIGPEDIAAVLTAFRERGGKAAVRAASDTGTPGTPLFLPHDVAVRFGGLTGDEGGRRLLAGETVRLVRLEGDRATRDLDTPEDWAEWRAEHDLPD